MLSLQHTTGFFRSYQLLLNTRECLHFPWCKKILYLDFNDGVKNTRLQPNELFLPYREEGTRNCSRKLADMMTICNFCITQNWFLTSTKTTHLVMDVTMGHT